MVNLTNVKISGNAITPILKGLMNKNLAEKIVKEGLGVDEFDENLKYPAEKYISIYNSSVKFKAMVRQLDKAIVLARKLLSI